MDAEWQDTFRKRERRRQAVRDVVQSNPEIIDHLREEYARRAVLMRVGLETAPASPRASVFGAVRMALPTEEWPDCEGLPMMGLCQLNLTELPWKPEILDGVEFLTIFQPGDPFDVDIEETNGRGWLLRAYSSLADLVEVHPPDVPAYHDGLEREGLVPRPIRWELVQNDQPSPYDFDSGTEDRAAHLLCEKLGVPYPPPGYPIADFDSTNPNPLEDGFGEIAYDFAHALGHLEVSKVGGWPTHVQGSVQQLLSHDHYGQPVFALQLAPEDNAGWMYGDCGVVVIARGTGRHREEWFAAWDCY